MIKMKTYFQHRKSSLRQAKYAGQVSVSLKGLYKPLTSRYVAESVEGIGGTTAAEKVSAITVLKATRDAKYKLPLYPCTGGLNFKSCDYEKRNVGKV